MKKLNLGLNLIFSRIIAYFFMIILAFIAIFPFYIIVLNSFKSKADLAENLLGLPAKFHLENYIEMWVRSGFATGLMNSLIVTTFSVLICLVVSCLASFAISRLKFKYNNILYLIFISGIILPTATLATPLFILFLKLKLLNNILNLILLYSAFGIPLSVFILTSFFKIIPKEIEDSARIDGCTNLSVFLKIILPLSKAPIFSVLIIQALFVWNDFMFPFLFIQSDKYQTLTLRMFYFWGEHGKDWTPIFAFVSLAVVPIIILFVLLQRYFMEGLLAGALKG